MRAIETEFKGYRFRSRLEARWAVFFEAMGLQWGYEVQGYDLPSGRYLPDFRITLPEQGLVWLEVKPPVKPLNLEVELCDELNAATNEGVILACGDPMGIALREPKALLHHVYCYDELPEFERVHETDGSWNTHPCQLRHTWVTRDGKHEAEILPLNQEYWTTENGVEEIDLDLDTDAYERGPGGLTEAVAIIEARHARRVKNSRAKHELGKLLKCDAGLLAAKKARSARFEHGENGL